MALACVRSRRLRASLMAGMVGSVLVPCIYAASPVTGRVPKQEGGVAACCLPDGSCSELREADCLANGGYYLFDTPDCSGGACDLGSCCYNPPDPVLGLCDDGGGAGIPIVQCDTADDGAYVGGALCAYDPCSVCEFENPANCQSDTGNFILINDSEVPNTRWADDFRPQISGIADEWCYNICFFNPTDSVECFADPPPDNFTMAIYGDADGDGLPDEPPLMPLSPIDVIAKEPEDIQTNRCWDYSFNVPNAPFLDADECYFVQLQGAGDPGGEGCTTYIQTSADGNSYSLNDLNGTWSFEDIVLTIGSPPDSAVDLAFCMNLGLDVAGGCGDWIGACCLPPSGAHCSVSNTTECPNGDADCPDGEICETCLANVAHGDCDTLGGLPIPGAICTEDLCPSECEQDECITEEVPNLNDPDDPGDCDAGLLDEKGNSTPCTRPFNNLFCDPTVVTTLCTYIPGVPAKGMAFGSDTWMRYTMQADECGILTISTCPTDGGSFSANGMLAAYVVSGGSGCPVDIVLPTDCGDDTCGFGGGPATVSVQALQTQDVYIRLGGWQGAQGTGLFVLSLDPIDCLNFVGRPNPNPEIGLGVVGGTTVQPCNTDADCSDFGIGPNVNCIPQPDGTGPGTCYVSASRYLSMSPNPQNIGLTARRITLDINDNDIYDPGVDHILGWVDQPFATVVAGPEPSLQAQARISTTSVYRNWNDLTDVDASLTGAVPVHVGDCEIAPKGSAAQGAAIGNVYFIQAINLGTDESDEGSYSSRLRLRTTTRYGDPVGAGLGGTYPSNSVSLLDAFAGVLCFQGAQQVAKWRCEMAGIETTDNVPDFADVTLLDVLAIVISFQLGGVYLFEQPCDCPGQKCP